jgi:hypothetical protein
MKSCRRGVGSIRAFLEISVGLSGSFVETTHRDAPRRGRIVSLFEDGPELSSKEHAPPLPLCHE